MCLEMHLRTHSYHYSYKIIILCNAKFRNTKIIQKLPSNFQEWKSILVCFVCWINYEHIGKYVKQLDVIGMTPKYISNDDYKYISNDDYILTNFVPINIVVIFQKLQQLLHLGSWSSCRFVVSRTHIIYLLDIWNI